ncbi:hypothetical protein AZE42_05229 [Rhizopogon vesiculosus]|uniref:Uncharacterized protein n=1 Tax=Rhizopogon vesiculosus TaxID=180088 RepID=A0A1J8QZF2_9AGAM|nr:hypothetical protein AZE42_05229 [Rhizopogon vesiculosus]
MEDSEGISKLAIIGPVRPGNRSGEMFVLKAGRRASHHALRRRAYATVDVVEGRKHTAPALTPSWSRRFQLDDPDEEDAIGPAQRTVCIRMTRLAAGMVDAFTVIRGVERKFGRIREYRFIRDGEVDSEYQMLCWASFTSEDSMNLIPESGINLSVAAPMQDPTIPNGGPGLEHLQGLFEALDGDSPSSLVNSTEGPSNKPRMIELNVQRAATDLRFHGETSPLNLTKAKKRAIGHSFYEWGGFYPLKPLYTSSPFLSQSEEPPPTPDHKQMRIALNKWSQILDRPDPSFAQMEAAAKAEVHAEAQAEDPAAMEPESDSDLSVKLSKKSRRRTRREVDTWVPLATSQPANETPSFLDNVPHKMPKNPLPSTPKVSRKERLLEQARSQARERVLEQAALRASKAKSVDLEKPHSETLRESVDALLQASKVDSQGDETRGSTSEHRPTADKPVGENSVAPAKEKIWNLVGKWF